MFKNRISSHKKFIEFFNRSTAALINNNELRRLRSKKARAEEHGDTALAVTVGTVVKYINQFIHSRLASSLRVGLCPVEFKLGVCEEEEEKCFATGRREVE